MKTMRRILPVLAATILHFMGSAAATDAPASTAADWPCWRGIAHTGISTDKEWSAEWPKDGPKVLWKVKVGPGCASVSVSGNRAYTSGSVQVGEKEVEVTEKKKEKGPDGKEIETPVKVMKKVALCEDTVFCLNTVTGDVLWKKGWSMPLGASGFEGGPCSTPCIDGKHLYVLGKTGRVTCLNAESGAEIWDYMPDKPANDIWGGLASSPLIDGGLLITSSRAFDKASGKIAWTAKHGCLWSSPVAFTHKDKHFIAFFGNQGLAAVDAATGEEAWYFPWGSDQNAADPIFFDDKVFVSSRRNGAKAEQCALLQLDENDHVPTVVWKNSNLMSYFHVRVLFNGYIYGADEEKFKCLDPKTGEIKWAIVGGRSQVTIAGDKLLIASTNGLSILEANPGEAKPLASAKVNASVPAVLANGCIYCRGGGEVTCLDVRKAP